MKILLISDTHIPISTNNIPKKILEEASNCNLCLHAGDLIDYKVFLTLSQIVKTEAVCGNMDNWEVKEKLPPKKIIEVEAIKIGLIHGSGHPQKLISFVNNSFVQEFDFIDLFVFGHSHCALDETINGKIYFNPGSPTDKIFAPYNSYGIISIENNKIERRLIRIE
ncbi:MAG: metallophosphoesterase [Candidatus Omnitrophica bacterium]|nr:metallophosphoesterase [Candidatus Omnitrophota bacterium]MCM8824510.1 metallophosphoesterase [Candidatus Omnitrophota bacterium]MCM8826137.1 metallophosphoesterase [Candidatus Omnitrophota bacterium]